MSRKKQAEKAEFVLFNVVCEDGSLSSTAGFPTPHWAVWTATPPRAESSKPRTATSPNARGGHCALADSGAEKGVKACQ